MSAPRSGLSELEQVVLALVWRDGPSTPYALRQHFLSSPTPGWSGSAGAIYPLVRRLEKRGHLRSSEAHDARGSRHYAITAKGRRYVLCWLGSPQDPRSLALGSDPVRTRLFFLARLPDARRKAFLAAAGEAMDEELERLRSAWRESKQRGDPFVILAARGALSLARARARWWAEVRRELG